MMPWILSDIVSLMQYAETLASHDCDQIHCLHCGKRGLWRHGHYPRKADRTDKSDKSLNPVFIRRYYCPSCKHTCSALPECIPARRWYLWDIQQITLLLLLSGKSLRAIAQEVAPSRRTIQRWRDRFSEQWRAHKDALCNYIISLGRTIDFVDFWQDCLTHISLARAMRLAHVAGVSVP